MRSWNLNLNATVSVSWCCHRAHPSRCEKEQPLDHPLAGKLLPAAYWNKWWCHCLFKGWCNTVMSFTLSGVLQFHAGTMYRQIHKYVSSSTCPLSDCIHSVCVYIFYYITAYYLHSFGSGSAWMCLFSQIKLVCTCLFSLRTVLPITHPSVETSLLVYWSVVELFSILRLCSALHCCHKPSHP